MTEHGFTAVFVDGPACDQTVEVVAGDPMKVRWFVEANPGGVKRNWWWIGPGPPPIDQTVVVTKYELIEADRPTRDGALIARYSVTE